MSTYTFTDTRHTIATTYSNLGRAIVRNNYFPVTLESGATALLSDGYIYVSLNGDTLAIMTADNMNFSIAGHNCLENRTVLRDLLPSGFTLKNFRGRLWLKDLAGDIRYLPTDIHERDFFVGLDSRTRGDLTVWEFLD